MRCITAIWPAGPPKLNSAIRSQTRSAAASDTPCAGRAGIARAAVSMVMAPSSRRLGRPVVALLGRELQPSVEAIVDYEAALQQAVVVVTGERRQTERDREQ